MLENFNLESSLSEHFLVCVGDSEGKLLQVSERFCALTGYSREELVGQNFLNLTSGAHSRSFFENLWGDLTSGKGWQGELSNLTKAGEFYWIQATLTPVMDRDGRLVRFVSLMTDVTPYKRKVLNYEQEVIKLSAMAEDLSASRDAAVQADRLKSEFLAGLSSSFRTPMSSILGFAQLLERSSNLKNNKEHLEHAQEILQAGRLLLETIDDLLEWSRAEAGSLKLKIEPLMLQAVTDSALSDISALAAERDISLLQPSRDVEVYAECDGQRLQQVLYALLSIAVENNRAGGWVSLDVKHEENEAIIVVADSGHGISPEQLACVAHSDTCAFDAALAFYQRPGLRLSLALSLMRVMGGSLDIDSQLEVGSSFTLTLPLSHAVKGEQEAGRKINLGRPLLILSVEDNLANARLLNAYVDRLEGATLLEANTAFHGLKLAAAFKPDVILMDINLPGMDGYEALKRLKADHRMARIKVAALTSDSHPEQVRRGLRAGFDAYLTKPLMFESLVKVLAALTRDADQNLLPQAGDRPEAWPSP